MTESASVYLLADAERAGRGVVTLVVGDLDSTLAQVAGRGIVTSEVQVIPGASREGMQRLLVEAEVERLVQTHGRRRKRVGTGPPRLTAQLNRQCVDQCVATSSVDRPRRKVSALA